MSLNNTPAANRLHIVLFGKRNSGKSSLINALTGQDTALVSDIPGTTTDAVSKAMEIQHIGPCLFIDTPGFDDEGELGEMRITRTLKAIERTDIALLLCEDGNCEDEKQWMEQLNKRNIPVILILNKADIRKDIASTRDPYRKRMRSRTSHYQHKRTDGHRENTSSYSRKVTGRFRTTDHYRRSG